MFLNYFNFNIFVNEVYLKKKLIINGDLEKALIKPDISQIVVIFFHKNNHRYQDQLEFFSRFVEKHNQLNFGPVKYIIFDL